MSRRGKPSGAFVGSLAGLGAGVAVLPITMDESTIFFSLSLGLALGGGLGFICDILAVSRSAEVNGAGLTQDPPIAE